jgi:putative transposase
MSECSIRLSDVQRTELRTLIQRRSKEGVVRRALGILALDRCSTVTEAAEQVCAARSTMHRWRRWYLDDGIDGLEADKPGPSPTTTDETLRRIVDGLMEMRPPELGYLRTTWSSRLLADAVEQCSARSPHPSTLRRLLGELGYAYKRARPTLEKADPDEEEKLEAIDEACAVCNSRKATFFVDEVAIELNPTIGFGWSEIGHQEAVPTPGINEKTYIAGALHADTGTITAVAGPSHDTDLFCRLTERLRRRYRGFSTVYVICDNAPNHTSRQADRWFEEHQRLQRLFQPVYHPWVNRIEKLWKQLHETVTRHHRCDTLDSLMNNVWEFLEAAEPFPGGQPGLAEAS